MKQRRSLFRSGLVLVALGAFAPAAAVAAPSSYGSANDRFIRANPSLKTAVEESENLFSRSEIEQALSVLSAAPSKSEPAARGVVDAGGLAPMGTVCVTVRRWQILAVSYALDVGQALSNIDVDVPGNVKWPSIFKLWKISQHGTGKQLRAWVGTQSWPKRACVSEGPA